MTDWKNVPLGEVCSFDKRKHSGHELPYVGMENISSGIGRFNGSLAPQSVKGGSFTFDQRHVLYGRLRPYLNKVLVPDFAGHCSTEVFPMLPNECLDRKFLFFWLTTTKINKRINSTCTGTRMPRANMSEVLSFEIPLPPREEQKSIVAMLDEAFAKFETARANAEANLENAKELFQSVLNDSLSGAEEKGWEVKQLGEFCSFQRGLTYTKKDEVVSSATCVLRANNVSLETGELDLSDLKFISDALEIPDNKKVKKGSLLICTASGSKSHLGKVALVRDEADFAFGGFMGLLTPKECLLSFYLHYLMKSDCYKDFIDGLASGTNINNLKWSQLFNFEIPLPPLEEQQRIVENLDALRAETDRLQQQYTAQITDLEDLRQSLLQQAFGGKLT